MATETELVNSALRKVGAKRIMDVTESVGTAGIAADILAGERDDLLRAGTWNFAVTRASLAALTDAPVFEYAHAFPVPSDCMRIISVHDNDAGDGQVEYKFEAVKQSDNSYVHCLVSAAEQLWIRYVKSVTDPNAMSSSFRQVLILRMAKIFAIAVARSNPLYQQMDGELKSAMSYARSIDGIEDYPERLPEGSWARSRRAWGWTRRDSPL